MNQARIQECLVIWNSWFVESFGASLGNFGVNPESFDVNPESFDVNPESFDVNPESFDVNPENYDVDPDKDDPQATDGQKENSVCCFLCLCCR